MGQHVIHATFEGVHAVRTRLPALAVLSLVAAATLTGCGSELNPDVHPGLAAVVEGEDVTLEEVDDYAEELCAWQEPNLEQGKIAWPMSYVRTVAVDSIVNELLTNRFAETIDFDREEAVATAEEQATTRATSPAGEVDPTAYELFRRQAFHDKVLLAAGYDELGDDATLEQVGEAGLERFTAWREDVDISVDPRFGEMDPATFDFKAPGSLAVRVSGGLEDVQGDQFDQEYVTSLPDEQRCG